MLDMTDKQPVGRKSEGPQGQEWDSWFHGPLLKEMADKIATDIQHLRTDEDNAHRVLLEHKLLKLLREYNIPTPENAEPEPVEGLQELKGLLADWIHFQQKTVATKQAEGEIENRLNDYRKTLTALGVDLD